MHKRDKDQVNHQQFPDGEPSRKRHEADQAGPEDGIEPRRPETMPRAEDDAATFANSPEFHDRVPNRD
jgi:hypothetical protein